MIALLVTIGLAMYSAAYAAGRSAPMLVDWTIARMRARRARLPGARAVLR